MVATGDDPEKDSPQVEMNTKTEKKASPKQIEYLARVYAGDNLEKLLKANNLTKLEEISMAKASDLISKLNKENKA